jgi:hypothetical protein
MTTSTINNNPTLQDASQGDACIEFILAKLDGDHLDEAQKSTLSKEEKALAQAKEDIEYALQAAGTNLDKLKAILSGILKGTSESSTELYNWVKELKATADNYVPDASIQSQLDSLEKNLSDEEDMIIYDQAQLDRAQGSYDSVKEKWDYWIDKLNNGAWYEQIAAPFVLAGLGIALGATALSVEAAKQALKNDKDGTFAADGMTGTLKKIQNCQNRLDVKKGECAMGIESGCSSDAKKAETMLGHDKQTYTNIESSLKYLDGFSKLMTSLIGQIKG